MVMIDNLFTGKFKPIKIYLSFLDRHKSDIILPPSFIFTVEGLVPRILVSIVASRVVLHFDFNECYAFTMSYVAPKIECVFSIVSDVGPVAVSNFGQGG